MATEVHAIGNVVDVATFPRLMVMRRAACCLKERAVLDQNTFARTPIRFVDELDERIKG